MARVQGGTETAQEDEAVYGTYRDEIEKAAQELYFYKEGEFPSLQRVREILGGLVWRVCRVERS